MRRLFIALSLAAATLVTGGCASINTLNNEVSTYGPWPTGRKPASFVFERLPSQQDHPQRQQMLEDAARGAVESAGFAAVADPGEAEYLMQVGARISSNDPWVYNAPLFWRGGFAYGYGYPRHRRGFGPGWGPGFGPWGGWGPMYDDYSTFDREVALIIRDRKTGQLLYEARASNSGPSAYIDYLLPAMFAAALKDFPGVGPNPRNVSVQISKQ
jgi:hypothetical protein